MSDTTTVAVDTVLIEKAMKSCRLGSERAAVHVALKRLVGDPITDQDLVTAPQPRAGARSTIDRTETDEPMTRAQVLAQRGSGFELTNDQIEGIDPIP